MISSCVFTFGESSVWDPKVVREYLDIPEDQLDTLTNLPEWSKSRHTDNASRIEKDTCENSQPGQLISNATSDRNEKLISQNKVSFDESCETRKSILKAYKLKSSKLFRSYSLFEIDRIGNNSFCSDNLRRILSVPNLYLFPENLYPNTSSELKNRDSSDRHLLSLNNIDLPVYKESDKACTTEQTNKNTSDFEKNKYKICSEISDMEVDAHLPVTTPCSIDHAKNNGTEFEILVENKTVSTNHASNSPDKLDSSDNRSVLLSSPNKFHKNISGIDIKAATSMTADNNSSCEKDVALRIKNMSSKSSNPEKGETGSKVLKSGNLNPSGKNEAIINTTEETLHTDAVVSEQNKAVGTNVNSQVLAKENETCDPNSESHGTSKELFTNENVVSPNEPASKVSSKSSTSKMIVENDQQVIPEDVSDNKPLFAETLSAKRKLESKSRSLKKRRKQGCHEERSIKKAGDISYSVEHIKTMLEIMKQFI